MPDLVKEGVDFWSLRESKSLVSYAKELCGDKLLHCVYNDCIGLHHL